MSSTTEKNEQPRDDSAYPDVLTTHSYDGIKEYDNPMPGWWMGIFILTIVWSGVYVFGAMWGFVDEYQDDLRAELDEAAAQTAALAAAQPAVDADALVAAAADPEVLSVGSQVFGANCAACHGAEGQGLIGPNLTDDAWVHGGEPMEVFGVVVDGVPAKGMPAWGSVLSQDEQIAVTAFIESIRGSNPPNPKAPEGEESPR